jgi:hypothetical protein
MSLPVPVRVDFITGNEREETTQDTIVTKSAACASYEINYLYTYITATYTRAKKFHLTDFLAPSPRQFVTLFQTASRTAAVEITGQKAQTIGTFSLVAH